MFDTPPHSPQEVYSSREILYHDWNPFKASSHSSLLPGTVGWLLMGSYMHWRVQGALYLTFSNRSLSLIFFGSPQLDIIIVRKCTYLLRTSIGAPQKLTHLWWLVHTPFLRITNLIKPTRTSCNLSFRVPGRRALIAQCSGRSVLNGDARADEWVDGWRTWWDA